MAQREVIVGSRIGLHARPAALFVKAATEQPVKITIRKGDGAAGRRAEHPPGPGARGEERRHGRPRGRRRRRGRGAGGRRDRGRRGPRRSGLRMRSMTVDRGAGSLGVASPLQGIGVCPGRAAGPGRAHGPRPAPAGGSPRRSPTPKRRPTAAIAALAATAEDLERRAAATRDPGRRGGARGDRDDRPRPVARGGDPIGDRQGRAGGVGRRPRHRRVPGDAPRSRRLHGGAGRRPRRRPRPDRRPPARAADAGRAGARHAVHPRRRRPGPGRHGDADARSGCSRSSRSEADRPATPRSWPGASACRRSSPARTPASLREGELVEVDGGTGQVRVGIAPDEAAETNRARTGSDARRGRPAAGRAGRPTATRSRCSSTSATPPERPRSPRSMPRVSACSAPSSSTSTGRTRHRSTSRSRSTPASSRRWAAARSWSGRSTPAPTSRCRSSTRRASPTRRSASAASAPRAARRRC